MISSVTVASRAGRPRRRRPPRGSRRRAGRARPPCGAGRAGTSPARSQSARWGTISRSVNRAHEPAPREFGSLTAAPPGSSTDARERSHSPSALACGSNRVEAATPSPSRPWMTKFRARRLRQARTARTLERSALRQQALELRRRSRKLAASAYPASVRAHTPRLASPPLSPERAPTTVPSGTPAASGRSVRSWIGDGRRRWSARTGRVVRRGGAIGYRSPSGSTAVCATVGLGQVLGAEHAVRAGVAGSGGQGAAGVRGQRELHGGLGEGAGPARLASASWMWTVSSALAASSVSASAWSVRASRQVSPSGPMASSSWSPDQGRLGLDVESTQDERHRVAVAAERVHADLHGRRWRLAPHPGHTDPVGPVGAQRDRVEAGDHVRARGSAGAPISYSSWAVTVSTVTAPPVPACLVMTPEPSAAARRSGSRVGGRRRAAR